MNIGESLVNSFEPEIFIRVSKMVNGEPSLALLKEVHTPLNKKYDTLLDINKGIIYLKKKGATNV